MRGYLFILLLVLFTITSFGQQYNFFYPKSNTQLPQQFINDIAVGPEGYMYIATGEGVSKFNGSDHVLLASPDSADDFNIKALYYGKTLFAGNSNGQLFRLVDGTFKQLKGTTSTAIVSITQVAETVWVLDGNSLYSVADNTLKLDFQLKNALGNPTKILSFQNKLYLTTDNGLYVFEEQTKDFRLLLGQAICIASATPKHILLLADNQLLEYDGNIINPVRTTQICDGFTDFYDIKKTSAAYWVASSNGLVKIPAAIDLPLETYNEANGLQSSTITGLVSFNNNLWIGSAGKGLCFFQPNKYFYWYPSIFTTSSNRSASRESTKLISSVENQISLFSYNHKHFHKDTTLVFQSTISSTAIINGVYYVGFENGTIQTKTGKEAFKPLPLPSSIPPRPITQIYISNNLTYLCVLNNGVYVLDNTQKVVNHFTTASGLPHNDVRKMLFDLDKIWFISKGTGICYFQNNRFHYFTLQNGLPSLEVTDATLDADGNIWLSTEGAGAVKINKNKSIEAITTTEGLSTNYLYGIEVNNQNQLITLGRSVINLIDLQTGESTAIEIMERIKSGYGLASGIIVIDNNYAFLTDEGLIFAKLTDKITTSVKMVMKQALYDNTHPIAVNQQLAYGDYKISLEPDIINLDIFSSESYVYKLSGFDKEWQPLQTDIVAYQSIKDGAYTFEVKKQNATDTQLTFSFEVKTPFWKKPLFFVVVLVAVVALSILYTRYRTKKLQEENILLEEKVQERTKELVQKNKELEQFSYAMSHDLKNPAINVSELVKILQEEMSEPDNDAEIVVEQLATASDKMLSNLYNLIEVLKYANAGELPKEEIVITDVVADIKDTLAKNIEESEATITLDLSGFEVILYNRQNFQSILYNLISNGIKYQAPDRKPEIHVTTFVADNFYCMTIADNGLGIDMEKHGNKLFGMFNRLHNHVEGSGIGLHLIKGIIEKNGGSIRAESQLDKGTTFYIQLRKLDKQA